MESQALSMIIKMLGALSLILGMLFAVNYAVRRWGRQFGNRAQTGPEIRVIAAKEIFPKKFVAVVDVFGHELILGVWDTGISLLGEVKANGASKMENSRDVQKGGASTE